MLGFCPTSFGGHPKLGGLGGFLGALEFLFGFAASRNVDKQHAGGARRFSIAAFNRTSEGLDPEYPTFLAAKAKLGRAVTHLVLHQRTERDCVRLQIWLGKGGHWEKYFRRFRPFGMTKARIITIIMILGLIMAEDAAGPVWISRGGARIRK
jgi:hypothetical protein